MSRLPTALEPLFPTVKRAHRLATRMVGATARPLAARRHAAGRGGSGRTGPWRGTNRSEDTVALEPDSVRLLVAADSHRVHRSLPPGDPEGHPFFEPLRIFDVPRRHGLEIRCGLAVGQYSAHLTPGGILDYETSEYFGIRGWREHPVFLRPRLPEIHDVSGTVVSLATRGTAGNYFHFLMELLPRWGIFRELWPDVTPDLLLLNRRTAFQQQLLAMLGLDDAPALEVTPRTAVRADLLLVPGQPNPRTLAPPWTTEWLRTHLPPGRTADRPKRIYLTRGNRPNTRRLVNEAELRPLLERHGFTTIDAGSLTVQDQIDHFAAADVVVAPHGAALTNLVFCRPGVRVLELFAPRYLNWCFWAIACNNPGSRYHYLVGDSRRPVDPRAEMLGVQDDITVDRTRFERMLERVLAGE
jgi:capsular polysaccharide biosynthesis protein